MTVQLSITIALALAAGCVGAPPGLDGDASPELDERLAERVALQVEPGGSLTARVTGNGRDPVELHAPAILGGRLVVRAIDRDQVVIEALELALTDFAIEKELRGSVVRVEFAAASLRLGHQVVFTAEPGAGPGELVGAATGELLLEWSLLGRNGRAYPLAPQRLRDAQLAVRLWLTPDGSIEATVDATADGLVKDFGEVELNDLWLSVGAVSEPR